MTPQERLDEQERMAYEEEQRKKKYGDSGYVPPDEEEEQAAQFDKEQTEMELKRATRSAETCTGVVEAKAYGEIEVTITFQEDGTVRQVAVPAPHDGTPLGDCITRAYEAVIVPPYSGGDQIMSWKLTLKKPEKKPNGGK